MTDYAESAARFARDTAGPVCAVDALTDFVVDLAAKSEPAGLLSEATILAIDERLEAAFTEYRSEVLAEVVAWLTKKAREFHAGGRKRDREQADTASVLASKIARGAIRPDNLRMLPNPGFFEVDHTYTREHHGAVITFKVAAISVSPDGRLKVAHGWRTGPNSGWEPTDSDDMTGWTDVTEAVAA